MIVITILGLVKDRDRPLVVAHGIIVLLLREEGVR